MRHAKRVAAIALAVPLAAVWLPAGVTWAQTPDNGQGQQGQPATPSAQNGNAQSDQLQEVVVTAERRATDIQTTPISMQAISGDTLTQKQETTIADLQNTTPNMQVNTTGNAFSVNIRGIGNSVENPEIQPGVAVFHDGLLAAEIVGIDQPFYDLQDVEVLRGPQGTLVTAASTAGAVEINSKNPDFTGVNGYVEGLVGNYTDERLDGAVNLPIGDTLAMRVAFNQESRGSFYRDIGAQIDPVPSQATYNDPGQVDDKNIRLGLLWKPSDAFNILFKADLSWNQSDGVAGQPIQASFSPAPGEPCPNQILDGFGPTCYSTYYHFAPTKPFVLNYGNQNNLYTPETDDRFELDAHWTLPGGMVLRSLTGLQAYYAIQTTSTCDCAAEPNTGYYTTIGPDDYYSEDLTLQSPVTGKLQWIVGADEFYRQTPVWFAQQSYTFLPLSAYPPNQPISEFVVGASSAQGFPGAGNIPSNFGNTARTQGIFGNVDWHFNDQWDLSVGLRGNWDEDYYRGNYGGIATSYEPGGWSAFPFTLYSSTPTFTDSVLTGKIGLNYQPIAGQFFYIFAARGYKPGGVQVGAPNFVPELVNDYELGWKSTLLEGHMQLQLGGYYMPYQDMQFTGFALQAGEIPGGAVINIGGTTTIDGIEFSEQSRFGGFGDDISVAYLHSALGTVASQVEEYRLPTDIPPGAGQCGYPGVGPICFNFAPYEVTVSGEPVPFSPAVSANIDLDYGIPVGNNTLRPRVSFSYVAKQYAALFQTDNTYLMPQHHQWNASLSYEASKWLVQAYVNNVANTVYINGNDGTFVYYGNPRQFGMRVDRQF